MKRFELLKYPVFEDDRGDLVPIEFDDSFPFETKRLYFVTSKDQQSRGGHAHKIEDEMFFVLGGSVVAVIDDGSGIQKIKLETKEQALLVKTHCWHEFEDFSENAVLVCLSSVHYLPGEENYITEKEEFYKIMGSQK